MALELFGVELSTSLGKAVASVGGVSLVVAARWLWRAQVIASLFRYGAILLAFIGALVALGVFDFDSTQTVELIHWLLKLVSI